jgi:NADPH2:quinone reductase
VLTREQLALGTQPLEAGASPAPSTASAASCSRAHAAHGFLGNIASVGLAAAPSSKTTVMPFILRGVNLLGINSSATPRAERLEVWQRIAGDLRRVTWNASPAARFPSRNCRAPSRPTSMAASSAARS